MIYATAPISSLSQLLPTDQAGSYSTLSIRTLKGPSLTSTSFLQATGQAWQVGSSTNRFFRTYSPDSFSARSAPKAVVWLLRVGCAPMLSVIFISTLVPYTLKPPLRGEVMFSSAIMVLRACLRAALSAARSAGLGLPDLSPLMMIALRFLLPPTVPVPPRPAARSSTLTQQANLTRFSPAWPIAMPSTAPLPLLA